jgi:diaminohydroxyphosphoribosylaminopyrimidine deaminase/5-amino-6-(5-phosphoribosylamino)uracil reductase
VEIVVLPQDEKGRPKLSDLMQVLAQTQLNEVMVESGHELAGAFLQAQMVDQIVLYIAPSLLGDAALGLFKLPVLSSMQGKIQLTFSDIRSLGTDLRIIAEPIYS